MGAPAVDRDARSGLPAFASAEPRDLMRLDLQGRQAHLGPFFRDPGFCLRTLSTGPAWAFRVGGRPLAVGGLIATLGPPCIAWGLLSAEAGPFMRRISAAVRRVLDVQAPPGVEAGIEPGDEGAERWAWLLGFRPTFRPVARWPSDDGRVLSRWLRPAPPGGSGPPDPQACPPARGAGPGGGRRAGRG
jgi:hypothetical protein